MPCSLVPWIEFLKLLEFITVIRVPGQFASIWTAKAQASPFELTEASCTNP